MEHTFYAPAKVNLFLKIISRRTDGYHNLVSLVDPIDICDVIHIENAREDEIVITDDKGLLPSGSDNTIYRAAKLLKDTYHIRYGVHIHVEKNIPIGSGLGGPSSDAATVLKGLAGIWQLPCTDQEQNKLGARIGADVPLFLYGKSCIMEGIGDIITPADIPRLSYVVVYPEVVMKTKEVYERLKIVLTKKENDIKLMGVFRDIGDVANKLENDLEQVGITMCPKIGIIKETLKEAGASVALMSGSGSSVFGVFADDEQAQRASHCVKEMGRIYVTKSMGRGNSYGDYRC